MNVVNLEDYRNKMQVENSLLDATELTAMSYDAVIQWAGADFERLAAAAKARDYRPEWIRHQIENYGQRPSAREMMILSDMIAAAGPYLSRRRRWVMRQVRNEPRSESSLIDTARHAAEYRTYKGIPACVRNDLRALVELGLVRELDGKIVAITQAATSDRSLLQREQE